MRLRPSPGARLVLAALLALLLGACLPAAAAADTWADLVAPGTEGSDPSDDGTAAKKPSAGAKRSANTGDGVWADLVLGSAASGVTQSPELRARQNEATERKRREIEDATQDDPWDSIWASQRGMISAVIDESDRLADAFLQDSGIVSEIRPIEQDIRRLLLLTHDFRQWPSPLEAVDRRLSMSAELVQALLDKASGPQVKARALLDQLDSSAEDVSDIKPVHHDEAMEYVDRINTARFMLTAVIARYESVFAPAKALVERVAEVRNGIRDQLPQLWLHYYTQSPVTWLSLAEWEKLPRDLSRLSLGFSMRRYVEVPLVESQWHAAITRFIIALLALGALGYFASGRLLAGADPGVLSRVRRRTLPLVALGVAFLAASWPSSETTFRLFMAIGSISLLAGHADLGWELRRARFPGAEASSPLFRLLPLALSAYVLLYLPLPPLVATVSWLAILMVTIFRTLKGWRRKWELGGMRLEGTLVSLEPLFLWPCLAIGLAGLHFYSMALYLLYVALVIVVQLSFSALSFISKVDEALDKEDSSTMLTSCLLAMAAPLSILWSFAVVSLCLATLPGGMELCQFYFFKSVSIGETQLNFVQVLLIATAFFLARTAAGMGKNFIGHLPERGVSIDRSLVTPLQTAFYYGVWCAFGLFALRSLGMNLSSLAVIAGGLSVGIGFGLQNIVNNFISGIILIFSRNLQVGDIVEVGEVVGRIQRINVRATVVETYDSATIYVPNSELVSGNLTNWTSNNRSMRQNVEVGVAYGTDTQLAVKTLLAIADDSPDILAYPQPTVRFEEFGDSALNFKLLFWVKEYDSAASVASDIRFEINRRFAEEGIEVAFPQVDVHMKDAPKAPPRSARPSPRPRPARRRPPSRAARASRGA